MTPKPILRIAAAVALIAGLALPAAARPIALDAPVPAAEGAGGDVITLVSGRSDNELRERIWRAWRRGEISSAERDLRLKRLERRVYERRHEPDWDRHRDRRYRGYGHGRRTLPASCIRRIEGRRRDREIFGVRCLERAGYRIVGPTRTRETGRPVYRAPRDERPYYALPRENRSSGSRLVYRNGELHLLIGR